MTIIKNINRCLPCFLFIKRANKIFYGKCKRQSLVTYVNYYVQSQREIFIKYLVQREIFSSKVQKRNISYMQAKEKYPK